ncbi:hypothetical protein SD71_15385 [Cohnella kolymensis]|uniref:Uncharacterized protein n=1 Tax=Cohnella kolymensis TaxID=1590652 RepID=A0ABR5A1W8_9BACL|nr:hypothetical protein SD71_15385 [Cohnella kolymensis]
MNSKKKQRSNFSSQLTNTRPLKECGRMYSKVWVVPSINSPITWQARNNSQQLWRAPLDGSRRFFGVLFMLTVCQRAAEQPFP